MEKIKIGQIGICHEHAGKIKSLRNLPDIFEIIGVVDDRQTTAAKYGGKDITPYEGLKWMTEKELFNVPGLQAVTIETPNTDLVPCAIRCMERNLAIHMDKPGGEDIELFRKLLDECKVRNLPFQMGYMLRKNLVVQWCVNAIRHGWLGEVFEIQASMSHDYGGDEYQEYIGRFTGGVMFNLGCHLVDLVVSIMGRPQRVIPFLKSTQGTPDQIKNNCLTILEYPYATATLRACSQEVRGQGRRQFKLCGTNGTVDLCPLEYYNGEELIMNLVLKKAIPGYSAGTHTINFGAAPDRYKDQFVEFAQIINKEKENPYSYEHDYLVQEVVMAASGYTKWV